MVTMDLGIAATFIAFFSYNVQTSGLPCCLINMVFSAFVIFLVYKMS